MRAFCFTGGGQKAAAPDAPVPIPPTAADAKVTSGTTIFPSFVMAKLRPSHNVFLA